MTVRASHPPQKYDVYNVKIELTNCSDVRPCVIYDVDTSRISVVPLSGVDTLFRGPPDHVWVRETDEGWQDSGLTKDCYMLIDWIHPISTEKLKGFRGVFTQELKRLFDEHV